MTRRPLITSRSATRVGVVLGAGALLVLATATGASAHVRVDGEDVTQGGYGVLTFRVPTESDTASTTQVQISFPVDAPIASASIQPVTGWTATVTSKKLAQPITTDDGEVTTYVADVTWKADAGGIAPGQFQQFSISAGPFPEVDSLEFPTLQTYSDGTTVDWNQDAVGDVEPEHPAPTLELAAAGASGQATTSTTGDTSSASPTVSASGSATDESDTGASWPGFAGLVAGVLGLVLGGVALSRTRRPTPSS